MLTNVQTKRLEKKEELEHNNQSIYDLLASIFIMQEYSPYSHVFYLSLFRKFQSKGVFDKLVRHVIDLCNSDLSIKNMAHLFTYIVHLGLKDKEDRQYFLDLWRETIEELDEEVQDIVLYQMKLSTERRFEDNKDYLSKEYEKLRFLYRADHRSIVLEGSCEQVL
jgi:hypothetical protein